MRCFADSLDTIKNVISCIPFSNVISLYMLYRGDIRTSRRVSCLALKLEQEESSGPYFQKPKQHIKYYPSEPLHSFVQKKLLNLHQLSLMPAALSIDIHVPAAKQQLARAFQHKKSN